MFSSLFIIKMIILACTVGALVTLYRLSFKKKVYRKILIVMSLFLSSCYILWRVLFTSPYRTPEDNAFFLVFFIILLLMEILDFFNIAVLRMSSWNAYSPPQKNRFDPAKARPADVLILTYKEDISLVEKTARACLRLKYPEELLKITVCDDADRPEIKELSRKLKINYISREKPDHAKAGNINNALKQTKGEFVLILDADMIVRPDFLEKTAVYFDDPAAGFVQAPQTFYNPDPFQHNLRLNRSIPNEQDLFMRHIEPCRASTNSVLHVGTNAVFRRSALEDIGGVPYGSVTEDLAAGLLIQAKGYKCIYVNEALAAGLAPERLPDFVRQRVRWCRGAVQVFKKFNPLFLKGLDWKQRFVYLDGLLYWLSGIKKLVYMLFPLLYIFFGVQSFYAHIEDIALFFIPALSGAVLSFRAGNKSPRPFILSHIYETFMAPAAAWALNAEAFFKRLSVFHVTPKGKGNRTTVFHFRQALPHIILLSLTLFAAWLVYLQVRYDYAENYEALWINTAWAAFNLAGIIASILVCIGRKRPRKEERFPVSVPAVISAGDGKNRPCTVRNFSDSGIKIEIQGNVPGNPDGFTLTFNNGLSYNCRVIWSRRRRGWTDWGAAYSSPDQEKQKGLFTALLEEIHKEIGSTKDYPRMNANGDERNRNHE